MVVVPVSETAWNTVEFQVFGLGILTLGQNQWKIVLFSTYLTAVTTIINDNVTSDLILSQLT